MNPDTDTQRKGPQNIKLRFKLQVELGQGCNDVPSSPDCPIGIILMSDRKSEVD
jgi:hypothetical protein